MPDRAVYNSRDARCKSPYGAVPSGTKVQLTLRPLRAEGFSRATMSARFEFRDDATVTLNMPWSGLDGARDLFTCTLDTGDYVGLVWYSFGLERLDGKGRKMFGPYQLTVYDGGEVVPEWFGEGTTYQIFPDRFRRTRVPDPQGMVGGRWVHTAWQEEPEFRPDKNGEIRNRDFFGGDLKGVMEKLDYLQGLGVETLYFCPIFEAAENHRYGTADYSKIDPMLGTEEDFTQLCAMAHQRGMRVMLDGVFNHTGYVSRYFNGDGFYPTPGACQSEDSPYRSWFNFIHWPDQYESWWGIYSLPAVNEHDPSYRNFIFGGQDSVVRRWLRAGADGWRLDVADELPDDFVRGIHEAARAEKPDAVIIGEVWEDGSTKVAYGVRRRHIMGRHCDGLMNYPFRNAVLSYLKGGDAADFVNAMETLRENYPRFAYYSAMNSLGTHDTARILTLLGAEEGCEHQSKEWRSNYRLGPDQRRRAKELLKLGAALMFAFPGSPTVYYGDEAGMEGFEDPFNRRTFPWGREDSELMGWFSRLGHLRKQSPALRQGDIHYRVGKGPVLAFTRTHGEETILAVFNTGSEEATLRLRENEEAQLLLGSARFHTEPEGPLLTLQPRTGSLLQIVPVPEEEEE